MQAARLFAAQHHPVLIQAGKSNSREDLFELLERHREELDGLRLAHGGVLLRGFDIGGAADFRAAVNLLGGEPYGYVGGNSPRRRVAQDVYTSTEYPAAENISLHNEMSYLPCSPARLFFYCLEPAELGGQTPLCSGRDVMEAIPADIADQFGSRRLRYIRNFDPSLKISKTWQATYNTDDRDELAEILSRQDSTCTWGADGTLRVTTVRDAFATHPETGEQVWFNQAEQWHPSALNPKLRALYGPRGMCAHDCRFGDGEAIPDAMLERIRAVVAANELLFDWQKNDLLMIDNFSFMHGRRPFTGNRTTLAYLSAT